MIGANVREALDTDVQLGSEETGCSAASYTSSKWRPPAEPSCAPARRIAFHRLDRDQVVLSPQYQFEVVGYPLREGAFSFHRQV
jgi:hypothetical protein